MGWRVGAFVLLGCELELGSCVGVDDGKLVGTDDDDSLGLLLSSWLGMFVG